MNSGVQPLRGGSMTTVVSAAGKAIESKMASADAVRNSTFVMPLAAAFLRAHSQDVSETSTPATFWKSFASVRENKPEPQYASTRNFAPPAAACFAT